MIIYVAAPSEIGPCKIGITSNVQERLKAIQTGNHLQLSIHHMEPIGPAAKQVERCVHATLAANRSSGGKEWFDISPDEAIKVIRTVAASADVLIDDTVTLSKIEQRVAIRWISENERLAESKAESDSCYDMEVDYVRQPSAVELLARTVRPFPSQHFNFNSYLLTWEDGMWLRWAFERLERRRPSGKHLDPYLEADDFLEKNGSVSGRDVALRWLEWSVGRDLRPDECKTLAAIWNRFVPLHNQIERNGPQWATHGIDDHVDDVHLFALSGDEMRDDRSCVVFRHDLFRAVLFPKRQVDLFHIDWSMIAEVRPLAEMPVTGFVTPIISSEVWEQPIMPWLREAPHKRDSAIERFLDNPDKRYPAPRAYDGPQPATHVWFQLPCIDEDGTC